MGGGSTEKINTITDTALTDWERKVILSIEFGEQELGILLVTVEDEQIEGQEEDQREQ